MKKAFIAAVVILVMLAACITIPNAAGSDNSYNQDSSELEDVLELSESTVSKAVSKDTSSANIYKYEFDSLKEVPDSGVMEFIPDNVTSGWLYELSGGENLEVTTGKIACETRNFSETYIDIKGKNGSVRFLMNSYSGGDIIKTQYWSAKQQDGDKIVKNFNGEIKSVNLYDLGRVKYLYGYTLNGPSKTPGEGAVNIDSSDIPEVNRFVCNQK